MLLEGRFQPDESGVEIRSSLFFSVFDPCSIRGSIRSGVAHLRASHSADSYE
jgi:hypothetical protein